MADKLIPATDAQIHQWLGENFAWLHSGEEKAIDEDLFSKIDGLYQQSGKIVELADISSQHLFDRAVEAQTAFLDAVSRLERTADIDIDTTEDLSDTTLEALMDAEDRDTNSYCVAALCWQQCEPGSDYCVVHQHLQAESEDDEEDDKKD
jgi:hypothetical protein